jgi:ADP-ribose pyrophosphatase YjhB (NUDIX family)
LTTQSPANPSSEPTTADLEARRAARRYPDRPIVAVLAAVTRGDRALIVQRAGQPNAGRWGFPGGVLELGETAAEGAMRELLEETGVVAEFGGWLNIHDAITRDDDGRVQFHYLLVAVHGIWKSGEGVPADDAAACAWVSRDEILARKYPSFPTLLPLFDMAMAKQAAAESK